MAAGSQRWTADPTSKPKIRASDAGAGVEHGYSDLVDADHGWRDSADDRQMPATDNDDVTQNTTQILGLRNNESRRNVAGIGCGRSRRRTESQLANYRC